MKFIAAASDAESFKSVVLEAGPTLCVVDAHSQWCGPCDVLNKKVQNLYQDYIECAPTAHRPAHRPPPPQQQQPPPPPPPPPPQQQHQAQQQTQQQGFDFGASHIPSAPALAERGALGTNIYEFHGSSGCHPRGTGTGKQWGVEAVQGGSGGSDHAHAAAATAALQRLRVASPAAVQMQAPPFTWAHSPKSGHAHAMQTGVSLRE